MRSITAPLLAALLVCVFASNGMSQESERPVPREHTMIPLPKPNLKGQMSVEEALQTRRTVRTYAEGSLTLAEISQLLWAAQGITDRANERRTAPSAGALYPLEVYLLAGQVEGLDSGIYRYDCVAHTLRLLSAGDARPQLSRAALGQQWIVRNAAVLVFTAVYSRTEKKYGERTPNYVAMEVGHAAQNVYLQATALGLGTGVIGAFDDDRVVTALSLPRNETPLYIMPVGRRR